MKIIDTQKEHTHETQEIFYIGEDNVEVFFGYELYPNEYPDLGKVTQCEVHLVEVVEVETDCWCCGRHRVQYCPDSPKDGERDWVEDWLTDDRKAEIYDKIRDWAAAQGWTIF